MDESCRTRTFIILLGTLCTLFCALQGTVHLVKYFNINDFDEGAASTYDQACITGAFVDPKIADNIKARICDSSTDSDCLDRGSNWTFVIMFGGWAYAALAFNFLLVTIGACSSYVRIASGYLFCLTGPAHLYAIYLTYTYRLGEGRYSELCEYNLSASLAQSGPIYELEKAPKTFAEDA